jgi:hypothetical protein
MILLGATRVAVGPSGRKGDGKINILDIVTSLHSAQDGLYNFIRFALASKIWGQSLSFPDDIIHCHVYAIRGIFVSKVTEHQRRRSYSG